MHLYRDLLLLSLAVVISLPACGGKNNDNKTGDISTAADLTADVTGDVVTGDAVPGDVTPDVTEDKVEPPKEYCLDDQLEAQKSWQYEGLDGPVEIVMDKWGVPHVYASSEHDMFVAQGFIIARYRFIQMHAMRNISSGTYLPAAAGGPGDLSADVYMRSLNMRSTSEQIWEEIQANDPEIQAMLEAFAEGVNKYIAEVEAETVPKPLEFTLMAEVTPWTPVDSLVVARLQSWELSFDGRTNIVENAARFQELQERWGNTPIAGIVQDLHPLAQTTDTLVLQGDEERRAPRLDLAATLKRPQFRKVPAGYYQKVSKLLDSNPMTPDRNLDPGSNNWTITGAHTESGNAMVANDAHLSLRNPSIFFEIHMNTTRAGGDIDVAGDCFPGIPAVILGRNAKAAWGATVYYADATDIYFEIVTPGDSPTVEFNGEQVPITIREEVIHYNVPSDLVCEDWLDDLIKGVDHTVETTDEGCKLTVQIWEVPHHGPMVPGSRVELEDDKLGMLTWRWTGFEPSLEMKVIHKLLRIASPDDFLAAFENFGVGAMNWVYGDVDGNIAYQAFCRVPIRTQIAAEGTLEDPPFLPVPGTGCCEWDGDVPLEMMPQSVNPPSGILYTSNGDALGHTLDGDPFNDETYQGYMFDIGFRVDRVRTLIEEHLDAGKKFTVEDYQRIQSDHQSPMGMALTNYILTAVAEAEAGNDEMLAPFAEDSRILAARDRLNDWDFLASSGALPEATQAEQKSSIATSIFATWLVFLSEEILSDKMESEYHFQFHGRFLINLFEYPETLLTWDEDFQDSLLWDNTTTDEVETRNYIILKALQRTLDFLADPEKVGTANQGGFGTDNMDEWLWGKIHGIALKHAFGASFNIPSPKEFPDGYPRPSDTFCVDAANPGFDDTDYTFSSGAAIRNVFTLDPTGPSADTIIPGGQDMSFGKPHYNDQFMLWGTNQTHPIYGDLEDILPVAEGCFILK